MKPTNTNRELARRGCEKSHCDFRHGFDKPSTHLSTFPLYSLTFLSKIFYVKYSVDALGDLGEKKVIKQS